jgi:TRAP-type uncharacterized transport system substrate-binding protein
MATGPEGSGYAEFGLRYRKIFLRSGVDLELVRTEGGVENLARLRDPRSGVSVAFVEAGLAKGEEPPELVSLGTISIEPFWLFTRGESQGSPAQRLAGKRISIEREGSGTRVLALKLLELNGVDETKVHLLGMTPDQSAAAMLRGEIDVAVMLTSWRSPAVQKLLVADGIVLAGYPRADAYVARFPSLTKVVLPMGVADLAKNIPPTDITLLAAQSNLVVRGDLHPATKYLLLQAASEIHGGPEIFHRAGRFPAAEAIDLPLADQAQTYYKSGLPFVYRYLPLWVAGLAERLWVVIIPLFAVVFPIANFLPAIIAFVTERRMFKLYGELRFVESQLEGPEPAVVIDELAAALEDLGKRANRLRVPLGYAQRLFILKSHIALAQQQVEKRRSAASRGDG